MMKAPFLLLLLLPFFATAGTFVVTSNADSGPGTLRDALQQALNNGSADADSIAFNLGATVAQRTISIKSLLPNLSSNLIIDGTSQPSPFMGLSNAKIIITPNGGDNGVTKLSYCFKLDRVANVAIFGWYFKGFCEFSQNGKVTQPAAIVVNDIADIVFGKPGRGNIVAGTSYGIAKFYSAGLGENISIQSNFFGVDTNGVTKILANKTHTNVGGVQIAQANNITVGGTSLPEGNLFAANTVGLSFTESGGVLNVGYNKFGTNPDETKFSYGAQAIFFASCPAKMLIHHNTFCGDGQFNADTGHVIFTNNFLGINRYKTVKFTGSGAYSGIAFYSSLGGATIGGNDTALANIFAYGYSGVINYESKGVSILKNSFYCHSAYSIDFDRWYTLPKKPFIYVNTQTANYVAGSARPKSLVELFYNDSCKNCEGQYFVARVFADAAGKWSYSGNLTSAIIATATNVDDSTTSGFSKVVIDTTKLKITNSSCGKNNGVISGLKVLSGTQFHWEDNTGKVVGTDTVLRNLAPGKYRFVCSMAFSACQTATRLFTITVENPALDTTNFKTSNPVCGKFVGTITNIKIISGQNLVAVWSDANGNAVSDSLNFKNAGNGSYKLTVTDTAGKCSVTTGPYVLVNQSGPTLLTDAVQVTEAHCTSADGSIKNIGYKNTTGIIYTAWQDAQGHVVGNTLDLDSVPAGRYRLVFKDASVCDTIITNYYTVAKISTIAIDTTHMLVTPALCKGAFGTITGITTISADIYNWVDSATHDTIATTLNISHLPAGRYSLHVSSTGGCQAQTNYISVFQAGFLTDTVVKATIWDANCSLNNGGVSIQQCTRDSSLYTFEWVDSATNSIVATHASAQGFATGVYRLYATDTGGCRQQIFTTGIKQLGKPQFDTSAIKITNSSCSKPDGAVNGLKIINGTQFFWQDGSGQTVGTDTILSSVAAGSYKFICGIANTSCKIATNFYTISDVNPKLDTTGFAITNPVCGHFIGSVVNIKIVSGQNLALEWDDANGNFISDSLNLKNAGNGSYKFILTDTVGKCSVTAGPFKLVNQSGPTLLTDSVFIGGDYCGQADGFIKNIGYKNTTGSIYTEWQNDNGQFISNNLNLMNVPAGRYRLFFKDESVCDTIITNYYTVADKGFVTIDTTKMLVTPSLCKGATGAINGVTTKNATIFAWINLATSDTVGKTINITQLAPGSYKLLASNTHGCQVQTSPITIAQLGFLPDTVVTVSMLDATCNLNNGYVTINQFTRDSSLYNFQWVDSATNSIIARYASAKGLPPGVYKLYATDTAGCRQLLFSTSIVQLGKPQFNYSNMQIISDTCNQKIGEVLFNNANPNGYLWKGYSTTGQQQTADSLGLFNLSAGNYYATITDKYNCTTVSDTFAVANYETSPPQPQADDQAIVLTTTAAIQVTNFMPGKYYLYDTVSATVPVNSSSTGLLVTPPVYYNKFFYIRYVQGDCASPLKPVWVRVYDSTLITVPNAFSPNGDGVNDTWHLQVRGTVVEYAVTVFNRYGQVVYTSNDLQKAWDGTTNGKPLPVGTYYYIIRSKDNASKTAQQTGYVVILR